MQDIGVFSSSNFFIYGGAVVACEYNSFKEYIQLNYIETLQDALGLYIRQNDLTVLNENCGDSHTNDN